MAIQQNDLSFVRAAVEELEAYLLSGELYWQLTNSTRHEDAGQLVSLTPGNLLLSLRKLDAFPWTPGDRKELDVLIQLADQKRLQWRTAWLRKVNREFAARVKLWRDYLDDATENGKLVDFAFNIRWRTVLSLLMADGSDKPPALEKQLAAEDNRLRSLTMPAAFIWEPELQCGFNSDEFWYLYRVQRKG